MTQIKEDALMGVFMTGEGASSVVFTDRDYNILRAKGKDLWSVRCFNPCDTAEERRMHRSGRRLLQRKKARCALLRSYLSEPIMAVDPDFFRRLDCSRLHKEDKPEGISANAAFDDPYYTDADYYKDYPTIFHLRHELVTTNDEHDPRLLFLALNHLFKHRGNFYTGNTDGERLTVREAFGNLFSSLSGGEYGDSLEGLYFDQEHADYRAIENICSDARLSKRERSNRIAQVFRVETRKAECCYIDAVCGIKVKLDNLIPGLEETSEKLDIDFSSQSVEERLGDIRTVIGDTYDGLFDAIMAAYTTCALFGILGDHAFVCDAKISDYEKHKKDRKILKALVTRIDGCSNGPCYNELFRSNDGYNAYVRNEKTVRDDHLDKRAKVSGDRQKDVFFDHLKKLITTYEKRLPEKAVKYVLRELDNGTFLPKLMGPDNRLIPNGILKKELSAILRNAECYIPELLDTDESGLTVSERIEELFSFKIPYFVGPSSRGTGSRGWRVENSADRLLPWNMEKTIDMDKTLEAFIANAAGTCTYLVEEPCMAGSSLLYERFCVLNELNNLRIDDKRLDPELKKALFHDVFSAGTYVTKKKLASVLKKKGLVEEETQITGVADKFTSALTSRKFFISLLGEKVFCECEDEIEQIIFLSTVYGTEKSFLKKRLEKDYGEGSSSRLRLNDDQIKKITTFMPKKWGSLSKKLLTMSGQDLSLRKTTSIMEVLYNDSVNLEEILYSSVYSFGDTLKAMQKETIASLEEATPDDLGDRLSANQKRTVWQTVKVIRDMTEIAGYCPKDIFICSDRDPINNKPIKKDARYKELKAILSKLKKDERTYWLDFLEKANSEKKLRIKKMYLYIRQLGKDLFTGEDIDLPAALKDDSVYNIEHIIPRHFSADDNIETNLCLVSTKLNRDKKDCYPLPQEIRDNEHVRAHWLKLLRLKLISAEKYHRLTSPTPLSNEQKAAFIQAKITESCVESKELAKVLKEALPGCRINYTKEKTIADFRNRFDISRCEAVNKYHIAQESYLAAVVGNVWFTKFGRSPLFYLLNKDNDPGPRRYNLGRMYDFDVTKVIWRNPDDPKDVKLRYAWVAPSEESPASRKGAVSGGTVDTVKRLLSKNSATLSFMTEEKTGELSNDTVRPAAVASPGVYRPLKNGEDVTKYGGMTSIRGAYFVLVEHTHRNKRIRSVESVTILGKQAFENDPVAYCVRELGLEDPKILIGKINTGTLFSVNGFLQRLTGRTGSQLSWANATSLKLPAETMEYVRKLTKATEEYYDKAITPEANVAAYEVIRKRICEAGFSRALSYIDSALLSGQSAFARLTTEKQIFVLLQILRATDIGASTGDLSEIGGSTIAGSIKSSKFVSNWKGTVKIVDQSPSGLISKEKLL